MNIYRMNPQNQPTNQSYQPKCRKGGNIENFATKVPSPIFAILLFASFVFSGAFLAKITLSTYAKYFEDMMVGMDMKSLLYATSAFVALLEVALSYCYILIYNTIAKRYLLGEVPCTNQELYRNVVPFLILRNIIWGCLNLLMFVEGGKFVSIGLISFEIISTMLVFLPAFFHIKKHYIKQGYGSAILKAYAVPYLVFQCVFLVF